MHLIMTQIKINFFIIKRDNLYFKKLMQIRRLRSLISKSLNSLKNAKWKPLYIC